MIKRSIVAVVAIALGSTAFAGAADAPKPMRTLVYAIQFSAQTKNAEQTSGFTGTDSGPPGTAVGHGVVERNSTASDDGTLTVDVVGISQDAGLVVDASFAGKISSHPPIRVAIFADGRLSFDPQKTLAAPAARLLPLLARGFVAGRDVSAGSTWKTEFAAPAKGSVTYRVSELNGEVATIVMDGDIRMTGPRGYDETDHGTTAYATDRLCPVRFDLTARSRHQASADQYVTENAHLTATLVSDTFAKK
jgi:hypothetical protein